jgi:hypothetical protein
MASVRGQGQGLYYRPYLPSDSESGSESDSDKESSQASSPAFKAQRPDNAFPEEPQSSHPNFRLLAQALNAPAPSQQQQSLAAGKTFQTEEDEIRYSNKRLDPRTYAYPYKPPGPPPKQEDAPATAKITPTKSTKNVIMLQSRDRDRKIYPQPTACQLLLPRDYKNVTNFTIAQINLTSAFFYFSEAKNNVAIQIYEEGSIQYQPVLAPPSSSNALVIINKIRDGSYNISQLLSEMQLQLNKVPIFYDFLNGFSDFYSAFQVNGDYSLNFNYPGDYYYDAVRKNYIRSPTKAQIVSFYFQSQYANQYSFTIQQVSVAYYYPVLKEFVVDPTETPTTIDFSTSGLAPQDAINYLLYSFKGISDPIVTAIIIHNVPILDDYRIRHTFRFSLVNEYSCSYNETNNRVIIQTNGLNASLSNLLVTKYNEFLTQQLNKYGISVAEYNNLATSNTYIMSVLQTMYDFLQFNLATYFAISYGTYSRSYYATPSNMILVDNGIDVSGVQFNYNLASQVITNESNILQNFRTDPPQLWPRMKHLGPTEGPPRNMGGCNSFPAGSNFPYNIRANNISIEFSGDPSDRFIDSSNYKIYTDASRSSGDILVDIQPGKYTVFQFRSTCRQTLQVETFPRPIKYRYPAWNKANLPSYDPRYNLFDVSYSYLTPSPAALSNITPYNIVYQPIHGWSASLSNFGVNLSTSRALWTSNYDTITVTNSNGFPYTLTTPPTLSNPDPTTLYTYDLNITFESPTGAAFPSDLYAFFYHDIAALSADLAAPRAENPLYYKSLTVLSTQTSSNTLSFKAYANQTYYFLVRASNISPATTSYRLLPWFPGGTTFNTLCNTANFDPTQPPETMLSNYNVAINNDPAFIRLPTASNLWGRVPTDQPINEIVYKDLTPIGYDSNGVSTDMTDYAPSSGVASNALDFESQIRIDPITNYVFQYFSPFDEISQSYFYQGSQNTILTKGGSAGYTPKKVNYKQYKIVNYNSTNYILNYSNAYNSAISPYIPPYTTTTTGGELIGYRYVDNILQLSLGVCGFMFIPAEGTWAIDALSFKTSFTDPTVGTNSNIHVLAVFYTSEVNASSADNLSLGDALAICLRTSVTTYASPNDLNLGFDATLGTYYNFSNVPQLVTRNTSNSVISGFNQLNKSLVTDPTSYYSAIAFTIPAYTSSNWNIHAVLSNLPALSNALPAATLYNIQNITGSPIAYPYANTPFISNTYYDGTAAPTGYSMVLSTSNGNSNPKTGPPSYYDESSLVYEQSIPWVNTNIQFTRKPDIREDPNSFNEWTGVPFVPVNICASVSNHMLFFSGTFAVTYYTTYNRIDPTTPPARTFSNTEIFTIDSIFPTRENVDMIAFSGNSSEFCFLGATPVPNNSNVSQLVFKVLDPATGILASLPTNSNYVFSNSLFLENFVFNDQRGWFISSRSYANNTIVIQGDPQYHYNAVSNTMIYQYFPHKAYSQLQMNPGGSFLYITTSLTPEAGFSVMNVYSFDQASGSGYIGSNGYVVALETGGDLPLYYTGFNVNITPLGEDVYFTNFDVTPNYFYKVISYTQGSLFIDSNTIIGKSTYEFVDSNGILVTPSRMFSGALGSTWLQFSNSEMMLGNRNEAFDAPIQIITAWQIFYPTVKVQMRRLKGRYDPMVDLLNLDSNTSYPEWPHVAMFSYAGYSNLTKDISGNGGQWGNESKLNFLTSDVSFNGFYFNSYIANIPMLPSPAGGNYTTDYYLAVRGWLPTETFQTYMRFSLPNRYDFGYMQISDLATEVEISQSNAAAQFNPIYLTNLLNFDSNFTFTQENFGQNASIGFPGVTLVSSNFGDFIGQYTALFSTLSTNETILNVVQSTTTGLINGFIATDMKYILPPNALNRQRLTDPILFKINWESQLSSSYADLVDQWGLGWNLGYAKADTDFAMIFIGESFYKIQEDYIYLRMNPEFNINRMDMGSKENYSQTREPGGTTNYYYAKMLLTSFGGNATTFIHNPVDLAPAIHRLSKLEFQWIGPDGNIIDNSDAEWDMVVNISEDADIIPTQTRTLSFPQTTPFTPIRNDSPSFFGDVLSDDELESLTEPEPPNKPKEEEKEKKS